MDFEDPNRVNAHPQPSSSPFLWMKSGLTSDEADDYRDGSASISELACVERPVRIGAKTVVQPFAHILPHAALGEHCYLGAHSTVSSGVLMGNQVRVMNHVSLAPGVILEDGVYIGSASVFAPLRRMRGTQHAVSRISPTLLRQGASLGPRVTMGTGLSVGSYAFIEAGSVVDKLIPDFALAGGDPIKVLGWRCQCGATLNFQSSFETTCSFCHREYQKVADQKVTLRYAPSIQRTDGFNSETLGW
ncbi:MAG: acyltransferase [Vampirovibrionales bacterium]|nr:acyltransferase [Vampirovibrionales bacterium]